MMLGIVTFALLNLGLALTQPTVRGGGDGCQFPKVAHTVRVTAEYEEQALLSDHTYQVTQQANDDFYHTYSEFDTDNGGGAKLGWEDKLAWDLVVEGAQAVGIVGCGCEPSCGNEADGSKPDGHAPLSSLPLLL